MSHYYLFQDTRKCIGCHTCEVVCKSNKNLPPGPKPCRIVQEGPKTIEEVPRTSFIFMPCFHCQTPWCVSACPTGAMQQRTKDGIVFVDKDLCVGCKICITACPWAAPQWNEKIGKVEKCDLCMDRIDQGLDPACVTNCTTRCLTLGKIEGMPRNREAGHAASANASEQTNV
nr:4Fe-4S dicluster domain-containing protein [uncultured Desulfobacter sp.]